MHSDLETLEQVDRSDRQRRALEASVQKAQNQLKASSEQLAKAGALVKKRELDQAELRTQEHAQSRKLHAYRDRRASASRVLQSGIGDHAAAERQIEQCDAILDRCETAMLEIMEKQDATIQAIADASAAQVEARAVFDQLAQVVPTTVKTLQAELGTVQVERNAQFAQLDRQTQTRYDSLVQRKRTAVAHIHNNACSSCRLVVQNQHIADLKRGLVIPCRGCHRWLVPA